MLMHLSTHYLKTTEFLKATQHDRLLWIRDPNGKVVINLELIYDDHAADIYVLYIIRGLKNKWL